MARKSTKLVLIALSLALVLSLVGATPVLALDNRTGTELVIGSNEVVNDNLFATCTTFTLDGTVKGDVIVFAQTVRINGKIEGSLMGAAQTIEINGTVRDNVRVAAAALVLGEAATVGRDLMAAGYALETENGSKVGVDLLFAGGQALVATDVGRNLSVTSGGLELKGKVAGDVWAEVGDGANVTASEGLKWFGGGLPPLSTVANGLRIESSARVSGDLSYTAYEEIKVPDGTVLGQVKFTKSAVEGVSARKKDAGAQFVSGAVDALRNFLTWLVVGLLMVLLFNSWTNRNMRTLTGSPVKSLVWGVIAIIGAIVAVMAIVVVTGLLAMLLGLVTMGGLALAVLGVGFVLGLLVIVVSLGSACLVGPVLVATWVGRWLMARVNPAAAEGRIWPMVLGVALMSIVTAIPYVRWIFIIVIVLLGFGAVALSLWRTGGKDKSTMPAPPATPTA